MRTYKLIDLVIQVFLLAGGLIFSFIYPGYFIYTYFFLGGWQVISALTHAGLTKEYYPDRHRKYYDRTVLIILLCAALLCIPGLQILLIFEGGLLLFFSPCIALWYIIICYEESMILKHKALVHLK